MRRLFRLCHLFILLLTAVLLLSCAVTAGSTFSGVIAAEATGSGQSDAPSPDPDDDGPAETRPQLVVRTSPDDADVWLDGRYLGSTPLDADDLRPGTYRLRIEAQGYYPVARWVDIRSDLSLVIEVELEQIVGYLSVTTDPLDAEVRVDGQLLEDGFAELPIGTRRVGVSAFGYRERTETVTIRENALTSLFVALDAAPFELSGVTLSRSRFNPDNPGATGIVRLSFRVSAPGDGTISVYDSQGTRVWSASLGAFDTWEQMATWDGTAGRQNPVPDGAYDVVLELRGSDGRTDRADRSVTVDSSLTVRYRSIWHAAPGMLYAYSLQPLPPRHAQLAVQTAGIITKADGETVARFPVKLGARVGVGGEVELGVFGSLIANSAPLLDRWGAGFSATWAPVVPGAPQVRAGISAGASYRSPDLDGLYAGPDTLADFPGFFAALPLELALGPLRITAAPEFRLAPALIIFGDDPRPLTNAWTPYGYLKSGALLDLRNLTLGLSTSVRSTPLNQGWGVDLPFQAGAEVHWVLPGSSLAITAFAAGEFDSWTRFYLMGGAGVGVLF